MKRFYSHNINATTAILEGKEKEHCIRVLRCQLGDSIEIVDGNGSLYNGVLTDSNKREAIISNLQKVKEEQTKLNISIACCIPKNASRWELFLEKATEIGITKIIPLISKRSEKSNIKRERNEQILLSAFKQSEHLFLPHLSEPIKFKDFVNQQKTSNNRLFIAHCEDQKKNFLGKIYKKGEEALILIGPEGDFTQEEISLALVNNFEAVSLGKSRLRVETAGIVVAGIINWVNSL